MYSDRLSCLEAFRSFAWGKNPFLKQSTRISSSKIHTIEYLDFGEHLSAVQCFCRTVSTVKIVVFEEYRAAMRRFKEGDVEYEKGACIIGHPGIGKSCFFAYAVIERLREEQPVAVQVCWRNVDLYLLFTASSVTIHEYPLEYHSQIWAFSDSDEDILIPMPAFTYTTADVRVFRTTSSAKQRWNVLTKSPYDDPYTMDAPSIEEVEDLAFVLGEDVVRMEALATKWGPVPRTLLSILEVPRHEVYFEQEAAREINQAIRNPDSAFATGIVAHNTSTAFSDSSSIFFIKPRSKTERYLHSAYVPTCWLMNLLVDELIRKKGAGFLDAMHSRSRFISDSTLREIVRCFLAREKKYTFRWYDQDIGTGGPVLPVPLDSFGFTESVFETDERTEKGSGTDTAKKDYSDSDNEYQTVRPKRRHIHTDT